LCLLLWGEQTGSVSHNMGSILKSSRPPPPFIFRRRNPGRKKCFFSIYISDIPDTDVIFHSWRPAYVFIGGLWGRLSIDRWQEWVIVSETKWGWTSTAESYARPTIHSSEFNTGFRYFPLNILFSRMIILDYIKSGHEMKKVILRDGMLW
jgi:hypothetical protein